VAAGRSVPWQQRFRFNSSNLLKLLTFFPHIAANAGGLTSLRTPTASRNKRQSRAAGMPPPSTARLSPAGYMALPTVVSFF